MSRRRRPKRVALLAAVALASSTAMVLGSPAGAATFTVSPGQSIQAAIDAAPSGSTILVRPGVYRENLTVQKDAITLQGSGPGATFLEPPASFTGPCAFPGEDGSETVAPGICVLGDLDFSGGPPTVRRPVTGVRVIGFTVRSFPGDGIFVFGGRGTVVQGNALVDNAEYGVFANTSNATTIANNTATGSDDAGIYVGDSPRAAANIRGNEAFDNGIGIFLRSASVGTVQGNRVHDNCVGILLLSAPNPPSFWMVSRNQVNRNSRSCPPGQGPPLSGIGILLFGALQNSISSNTVNDNAPGGPTVVSGGIVLAQGASGNSVSGNQAHRNVPVDLADDSGAPNRFSGNVCETSRPPGLCQLR